jgi:hypothetical protein
VALEDDLLMRLPNGSQRGREETFNHAKKDGQNVKHFSLKCFGRFLPISKNRGQLSLDSSLPTVPGDDSSPVPDSELLPTFASPLTPARPRFMMSRASKASWTGMPNSVMILVFLTGAPSSLRKFPEKNKLSD